MTTQVIQRSVSWPGIRPIVERVFPHPVFWLVAFAMFAANGTWLALSPRMSVESAWLSEQVIYMGGASVFAFLRAARPDIFHGFMLTFWRIAMTAMFAGTLFRNLAVYNHLTMGLNFGMSDTWLHSLDRAIGFDWLAAAKFLTGSPTFNRVLQSAYFESSEIGMFGVILLWLIANKPIRVLEAAFIIMATAITCATISAGFPSEGAFPMLADAELKSRLPNGTAVYHMRDLLALRSGEPVKLVLDRIQGLSTFPSFHTCMALVIAWCSRGYWWSWIPGATLGFLILLATPVFGGHYLVDMLFGAAIFVSTVGVWQKKLVKNIRIV